MSTPKTQRASVNGTELAFEIHGEGEPVICIAGSFLADGFAPLAAQPSLSNYRMITYHRRGYGDSAPAVAPVSIADQAADCRALLQYLDIDQAHVVGHSYGGTIALQLALDAPQVVSSLALLEPLLPRSTPKAQQYLIETVTRGVQLYSTGDKAGSIVSVLTSFAGPDIWNIVDRVLGHDAYIQAVADADTFFQVELVALQAWPFVPGQAPRDAITRPVLSVLGSESDSTCPGFAEGHEFLLRWLPHAEGFDLPHATHGLQIMNPQDMAKGLHSFLRRHDITRTA